MEELFVFLIQVVVYGLLLNTGKVLVFLISLGRWRSARVLSKEHRWFSTAGALSHRIDGQRVVTETGLIGLGITFYVLLAIFLLYVAAR